MSSQRFNLFTARYPARSGGDRIALRLRSYQSSPCPRVLLSSHAVLALTSHKMLGCSRAHGHQRRLRGEGHDRLTERRRSAGPHLALASSCSLLYASTSTLGARLNLSFRSPFEVPHASLTRPLTTGHTSSNFHFLTSDPLLGLLTTTYSTYSPFTPCC